MHHLATVGDEGRPAVARMYVWRMEQRTRGLLARVEVGTIKQLIEVEMKRLLLVSLAFAIAAASLAVAGCAPAAPAPAPTKAPSAPTAAPAAPTAAAAPTKAPEPTKAPAPQPTAVPAKKVTYPEKGKAISMIVAYAAGGSTDINARLLASYLEKELGTTVNVVNRAGAATQVGTTELAKAKPDGYTVGITHVPTNLAIYLDPERQAAFSRKDLQLIAVFSSDPMVIGVKSDSPYKTAKDLVDAAKANPEKVSVCTAGINTAPHLALLQLQRSSGARFASVQADGDPQCIASAMGGHLNAVAGSPASFVSVFKSGEMIPLAITGPEENKFLPGVKPLKALGYDVNIVNSRGLSAPAGVSLEIVDLLAAAVKKILDIDDFKKKSEEAFLALKYMGPAEYSAHWAEAENVVKVLLEEGKKATK